MTRNESINKYKTIAACFVVFIHCPFPGVWGEAMGIIARWAVPFFFIISGYYLSSLNSTCREMRKIILKKIVHTIKVFVLMQIIYMLISIGEMNLTELLTVYFSSKSFLNGLIYGSYGLCGVGWFVCGLLICYLLSLIFCNRLFLKRGGTTAAAILLVLLAGNSICLSLHQKQPLVFRAIPPFIAGILVRYYEKNLRKIPDKLCILFCFLWCSFELFWEIALKKEYVLYAGFCLMAVLIFLLAVKHEDKRRGILSVIGEKYSMYIFFSHLSLIMLLNDTERQVVTSHALEIISSKVYLFSKPILVILVH